MQCPQQDITQLSTGGNAVLVTFAVPTGQDNCGTATVACTAMSPANSQITLSLSNNQYQGSFPVGTSPVTCTATDGASPANTAPCNFNVVGMSNDGLKFEWISSRSIEIQKLCKNIYKDPPKKKEKRRKEKKSNAACIYTPTILKLLIIVQMWKQLGEGNLIAIILTPHLSKLIKYF